MLVATYMYQHSLLSELPTCCRVAVGNDICQIKYKLCTYMEQVLDQNTFSYVQVVTECKCEEKAAVHIKIL